MLKLKYNVFLKCLSWPLAIVFSFNTIAWALPSNNTQSIVQNPQIERSIIIPEQYGDIKQSMVYGPWSMDSPSRPLVVMVKDAHCHYEAQKNISKILDILISKYKIDLIGIEGAVGSVEPSVLAVSKDKKKRSEVGDKYMKKGYLTASETLAIVKGKDYGFSIWGVEDQNLYLKDLQAFKDVYSVNGKAEEFIKCQNKIIEGLKSKFYSKNLQEFDAFIKKYLAVQVPLTDLLIFLSRKAPNSYFKRKNLAFILHSIMLEEKVDFSKVEKERTILINFLQKKLTKEEIHKLVQNSLEFRLGNLSSVEYYKYLKTLIKPNMYNANRSLLAYAKIIALQNYINEDELFEEIDSVVEEYYRQNLNSELANKLYESDKYMYLLNKLLRLEITRDELIKIKETENRPSDIAGFLGVQAAANNISSSSSRDINEINDLCKKPEFFYEYAIKRDKAVTENLIKKMKESNKRSAVLVLGGFHADGAEKILKDEGFSVVTISPSITKEDKEARKIYLSRMLDPKIQPKNLIKDMGFANIAPLVVGALCWRDIPEIAEILEMIQNEQIKGILTGAETLNELRQKLQHEKEKGIDITSDDLALIKEFMLRIDGMPGSEETISILSKIFSIKTPSIDRVTTMIGFPDRLMHSTNALKTIVEREYNSGVVIYDIGTGWYHDDGPIATRQLKDALGEKAEILGVDNRFPAYVIYNNDKTLTALFDDRGEIYYVMEYQSCYADEEIPKDLRTQCVELFKELMAKKPKDENEFSDENNNKITVNPIKTYERKGLGFAKGDLFNLGDAKIGYTALETKKAHVVRISNVLLPHYSLSDIRRALAQLLPFVHDNGYVIISYTDSITFFPEEAYIYRKRGDAFVLENYLFSVKYDLFYGTSTGSGYAINSPVRDRKFPEFLPQYDDILRRYPEYKDILGNVDNYVRNRVKKDDPYYQEKSDALEKEYYRLQEEISRYIAELVVNMMKGNNIEAEALGSMVSVKIEEPKDSQNSIKRTCMQVIKENVTDPGMSAKVGPITKSENLPPSGTINYYPVITENTIYRVLLGPILEEGIFRSLLPYLVTIVFSFLPQAMPFISVIAVMALSSVFVLLHPDQDRGTALLISTINVLLFLGQLIFQVSSLQAFIFFAITHAAINVISLAKKGYAKMLIIDFCQILFVCTNNQKIKSYYKTVYEKILDGMEMRIDKKIYDIRQKEENGKGTGNDYRGISRDIKFIQILYERYSRFLESNDLENEGKDIEKVKSYKARLRLLAEKAGLEYEINVRRQRSAFPKDECQGLVVVNKKLDILDIVNDIKASFAELEKADEPEKAVQLFSDLVVKLNRVINDFVPVDAIAYNLADLLDDLRLKAKEIIETSSSPGLELAAELKKSPLIYNLFNYAGNYISKRQGISDLINEIQNPKTELWRRWLCAESLSQKGMAAFGAITNRLQSNKEQLDLLSDIMRNISIAEEIESLMFAKEGDVLRGGVSDIILFFKQKTRPAALREIIFPYYKGYPNEGVKVYAQEYLEIVQDGQLKFTPKQLNERKDRMIELYAYIKNGDKSSVDEFVYLMGVYCNSDDMKLLNEGICDEEMTAGHETLIDMLLWFIGNHPNDSVVLLSKIDNLAVWRRIAANNQLIKQLLEYIGNPLKDKYKIGLQGVEKEKQDSRLVFILKIAIALPEEKEQLLKYGFDSLTQVSGVDISHAGKALVDLYFSDRFDGVVSFEERVNDFRRYAPKILVDHFEKLACPIGEEMTEKAIRKIGMSEFLKFQTYEGIVVYSLGESTELRGEQYLLSELEGKREDKRDVDLFYEERYLLSEEKKAEIRNRLEPYRQFLKANFDALQLIKSGMTVKDLLSVTNYLKKMIILYARFAKGLNIDFVFEMKADKLSEFLALVDGEKEPTDLDWRPVLADNEISMILKRFFGILSDIDSEIQRLGLQDTDFLPSDFQKKISSLEDNKQITDKIQLHGLINYIHQLGFSGLFAQRGWYVDVETVRRFFSPTELDHVRNYTYTNVTRDYKENHPFFDLFNKWIANVPSGRQFIVSADIVSDGPLAMFKVAIGEHSLEMFTNLTLPSEGGAIILEYKECERVTRTYGGQMRLEFVKRCLENAGYRVELDKKGGFIRAVMDNNNAGSISDLEKGFKAAQHVINISSDIDSPFENLKVAGLQGLVPDAMDMFIDAFNEERVFLPVQVLHKLAWEYIERKRGKLTKADIDTLLSSQSTRLVIRANSLLGRLGLPLIPDGVIFTQKIYNRYVREPIEEGIAIGRFVRNKQGSIEVAPGFVEEKVGPAGYFAHQIFEQDEVQTERVVADMILTKRLIEEPRFAIHLMPKTVGRINNYSVQEISLDIVGGVITIIIIRNPVTDEIVLAKAIKGNIPNSKNQLTSKEVREILYRNGYPVGSPNIEHMPPEPGNGKRIRTLLSTRLSDFFGAPLDRGIMGMPVSAGVAVGEVVFNRKDVSGRDAKGKILVSKALDVDDDERSNAASGLIPLRGSVYSHAAIIARESKIPAITGLRNAELKDGRLIVQYETFEDNDVENVNLNIKGIDEPLRIARTGKDKIKKVKVVIEEGDIVFVDAEQNQISVYKKGSVNYQIFLMLKSYIDGEVSSLDKLKDMLTKAIEENNKGALWFFIDVLIRSSLVKTKEQKTHVYNYITDDATIFRAISPICKRFLESTVRKEYYTLYKVSQQMPMVSTFAELSALIGEQQSARSQTDFIRSLFKINIRSDLAQHLKSQEIEIEEGIPRKFNELKERLKSRVSKLKEGGINIANAAEMSRCLELARANNIEIKGAEELEIEVNNLIESDRRDKASVFVIDLKDAGSHMEPLIGGKAANLAELMKLQSLHGFHVPRSHSVTAKAYDRFVDQIVPSRGRLLSEVIDEVLESDEPDKHTIIEKYFIEVQMPDDLKKVLDNLFKDLKGCYAVRSSAIGEDGAGDSFAGQLSTFLGVKADADELYLHLKKAWASLYTNRAINYRAAHGLKVKSHAVIIQEMVDSKTSGVVFTTNAVKRNYNQVVIEGVVGIGEGFVGNKVPSDYIAVNKSAFDVEVQVVNDKDRALVFDSAEGRVIERLVDGEHRYILILTPEQVRTMTAIAHAIEEYYGYPQDIEWGISEGKIYILQTRPITTLAKGQVVLEEEDKSEVEVIEDVDVVRLIKFRRSLSQSLGLPPQERRMATSQDRPLAGMSLDTVLQTVSGIMPAGEWSKILDDLNDKRWVDMPAREDQIKFEKMGGLLGETDGYYIKLERFLLGEGDVALRTGGSFKDVPKPALLLLQLYHESAHRRMNFRGVLDEIIVVVLETQFFLSLSDQMQQAVFDDIEKSKEFLNNVLLNEEDRISRIKMLDIYLEHLKNAKKTGITREKIIESVLDYLSKVKRYEVKIKDLLQGGAERRAVVIERIKLYLDAVNGDDLSAILLAKASMERLAIKYRSTPAKLQEIASLAVEKYNPSIPNQCGPASDFIQDRLNALGIRSVKRIINIPYDCTKAAETGDATTSHIILEVALGEDIWIIDTQLLQFTQMDRNKLNLPTGFVSQYVYPASFYYSIVPCYDTGFVIVGEEIKGSNMVIPSRLSRRTGDGSEKSSDTVAAEIAGLLGLKDDVRAVGDIAGILEGKPNEFLNALKELLTGESITKEGLEKRLDVVFESAEIVMKILDVVKGELPLESLKQIRETLSIYLSIKKIQELRRAEKYQSNMPEFMKELFESLTGSGFDGEIIRELLGDLLNAEGYFYEDGQIKQSEYFRLMLDGLKTYCRIEADSKEDICLKLLNNYKFRVVQLKTKFNVSESKFSEDGEILNVLTAYLKLKNNEMIDKVVDIVARYMAYESDDNEILKIFGDVSVRSQVKQGIESIIKRKQLAVPKTTRVIAISHFADENPPHKMTAELLAKKIQERFGVNIGLGKADTQNMQEREWTMNADEYGRERIYPIAESMDKVPKVHVVYPINVLPAISTAGTHCKGIYLGFVDGVEHPVAIKLLELSKYTEADLLAEVVKTQVFDCLGYGPKFYGITENLPGGLVGIVMQVVPGRDDRENPFGELFEACVEKAGILPTMRMKMPSGNLAVIDAGSCDVLGGMENVFKRFIELSQKEKPRNTSSAQTVFEGLKKAGELIDNKVAVQETEWQSNMPLVVEAKLLIGGVRAQGEGRYSLAPLGETAVWFLRKAHKVNQLKILCETGNNAEREAVKMWLMQHGINLEDTCVIENYPTREIDAADFGISLLTNDTRMKLGTLSQKHRIISGNIGDSDMLLMNRMAMILAGNKDIKVNMEKLFLAYYDIKSLDELKDTAIKAKIEAVMRAIELGRFVLDLPPVAPFIKAYFNILKTSSELVASAA